MKKIIASSDYPGFKVLVRAVREDKGTFAGEVIENVFQKSGIEYKVGENVGGLKHFVFTFTVVDNVYGREIKTPVTFEKVVEMFKEINLSPVKRIVKKLSDFNGLKSKDGLITCYTIEDTDNIIVKNKYDEIVCKVNRGYLKILENLGFEFELSINKVFLFGNMIDLDDGREKVKNEIKEIFKKFKIRYRDYIDSTMPFNHEELVNNIESADQTSYKKFKNIVKEILEEKEEKILEEIRKNGKPFSNEHDFIIHWTKKYGWSAITLGTEVIAGNCYLREDIANEYVEKLKNL